MKYISLEIHVCISNYRHVVVPVVVRNLEERGQRYNGKYYLQRPTDVEKMYRDTEIQYKDLMKNNNSHKGLKDKIND